MESKIIGQLKQNEHFEDWFESVPVEIPYFEGQKLKVTFTEAMYKPYMDCADNALGNFLNKNSEERVNDSELVYKYYSETLNFGYTKPLNLNSKDEIWKFIKPSEIMIDWDENENFYLCVSCGCEWEEEHGLQLVFKNGEKLTRASGHDGQYTD
jgi:hypothetical protein